MRLSEGKEDILMKYIIFANEFPNHQDRNE